MRFLVAALAIALMMASAQAQVNGANGSAIGGSGIGQHAAKANQETDKGQQKPKADDKAYNAALHNLPNKQYDPWRGVR
jgi:hypothetical protein